jgi:hypothetical protein
VSLDEGKTGTLQFEDQRDLLLQRQPRVLIVERGLAVA